MTIFKSKRSILILIVLISIVLRIWGLGFGLPYQFHQDEPIVVNHALAYGTGDLNPHFSQIPPLTSYLLFFVYIVMFLMGRLAGAWSGSGDFALFFFKDPTLFYFVGRVFIGMLPGIFGVLLTYRLSRKFLSENAALYSAAAMAVIFLNVVNSHYIYTDMLLTMVILLVFDRLFSLVEKPVIRNYIFAGSLLGVAIGVKYNALFLVVPCLAAHFAACRNSSRKWYKEFFSPRLLAAGIAAAVTLFISAVYLFLDIPSLLQDFAGHNNTFWHTGWRHHIFYSFFQGMSPVLTVLGLTGLVLFCLKGKAWGRVFCSFPAVYYLVLVHKSQVFARYVLVLIPFVAIGAAYLIFDVLIKNLGRRAFLRKIIVALALLLLLPTALKSIKADMLFSSNDTRVEAAEWIEDNLPRGTKIACDGTTFRPTLKQPYSQLIEKRNLLRNQTGKEELKSRKLDLMLQSADKEDKGYPLYFLSRDVALQGQFMSTMPAIPYSLDAIEEQGIEYIVINGQLSSAPKDALMRELKANAVIVKDFSPYKSSRFRQTSDPTATTCIPVSSRELFSRKSMGPGLRIYKLK